MLIKKTNRNIRQTKISKQKFSALVFLAAAFFLVFALKTALLPVFTLASGQDQDLVQEDGESLPGEDVGDWDQREPEEFSDSFFEDDAEYEKTGLRQGRVSAGLYHTLLSNEAGFVFAWGDNSYGQLGIGSRSNDEVPMPVEGLENIVSVSAGQYHSLALSATGDVYAWGRNTYGQLGNASSAMENSPIKVSGLPEIKKISAGGSHSLALDVEGNIYGWGMNTYGQIGEFDKESEHVLNDAGGVLGIRIKEPVKIAGPGIADIEGGGNHSLYIDSAGDLYAWGDNSYGQLGSGGYENSTKPLKVEGISNLVAVSAGWNFNLAISAEPQETFEEDAEDREKSASSLKNLFSWGSNSSGQLGLGNGYAKTDKLPSPLMIKNFVEDRPEGLDFHLISAGYTSSMASYVFEKKGVVRESVLVWGNNAYGQLGIGQMPSQSSPLKLRAMSNAWEGGDFLPFQSLSAGAFHSVLLGVQGFAAVTGRADKFQLGNVSSIDSDIFREVKIPDGIAPEWLPGESIDIIERVNHLDISWPHALDNIGVTGYILTYVKSDGLHESLNLDTVNAYRLTDPLMGYGQNISIYAIDGEGNISMSPLRYLVLDAEIVDQEERATPLSEKLYKEVLDEHGVFIWSPALYASNQQPEVPWDRFFHFDADTFEAPADYTIYYAIITAGLVVLVFILIGILGLKKSEKLEN